MKHFFFFFGSCFWLVALGAQNQLPYDVFSKNNQVQAKVYQTSKSKKWRVACIKNEQVIWKIMDFSHNGDKNHSYVSSLGHLFVQINENFTKPEDVVLSVWRYGELVWEYPYKELFLPEESAIQLPNKKWIWLSNIDVKSDEHLEIYLQSGKKFHFSLVTGLPLKMRFLDRFWSSGTEDDLLSKFGDKSKAVKVQDLLNKTGLSSSYSDTLKKETNPGILRKEFNTRVLNQKVTWQDFYQDEVTILHPDTLILFILRFCSQYFTPEEMIKIGRFEYSYDLENGYYTVRVLPKLPYSEKFQLFLNPKFSIELDKERVCSYLRITLDGKVMGCFFEKE